MAAQSARRTVVAVGGHELQLSNQNKLYFPEDRITKGDVLRYYDEIAPFILPYLKDRPESLRRNPNGIADAGFFHKDAGEDAPDWVATASIHSDSGDKDVHYILCNDRATLLYLNNLGCIELNPWFSRISSLDAPDYFVIDIDPSPGSTFDQVVEAALAVRQVLNGAGVDGCCKTSGATGLHVFVPLAARYSYRESQDFAHIVAVLANQLLPRTTTVERPLRKRGKKIYLDYLQNVRGQTLAAVYSLRPKPGATVATPLEWREVRPGLRPGQFTIKTVPARLKKKGDLFSPVLRKGIDLRKALARLGG